MVERQCRFDHAGRAGGGFGMADHRLDRSQRASFAHRGRPGEDAFQRAELDFIADTGAGAMGFEQPHRFRRDPGLAIGFGDGTCLALGPRGINALRSAVAGGADAADDGIDPVSIAPGVVKTLEHEHADALAQHGSVGCRREGTGVAGVGKHTALGKAHVHKNVVDGVDAPGHHHVAFAAAKFQQRQVDRAQAAGAGGVNHAVGPAEVKPVADTAGHDVAQQSGKGVFLPGHISIGNFLDDGGFLLFVDALVVEGATPVRVTQPGA